jgi:cell fate (sporulation/competence/biofilm development) regulator YlbF (YheA/YmcA/DUF963 family)
MQNVYDIARELVHSLKECDQYKNYKAAKAKVDANEDLTKMINDFTEKGIELQTLTMTGQTPDEETLTKYQQLYGVVMSDPSAAEYLNAQMMISQIVSEIYQMIGEALNE